MSREVGRRVGGLTVQARYGGEVAARARKGLVAKFEREADPAGVLPEAERIRRGALLHRAHMIRCAAKSAEARKKNRRTDILPTPKPTKPAKERTVAQRMHSLGTRLNNYGLTLDEYSDMLDAQSGLCALCKSPPAVGKSLCIDHDHSTGRVRGLLCHRCNSLLGGYEALADHELVSDYLAPAVPDSLSGL